MERRYDRHDAAQLFARVDGGVTRPRRLAADVEDVGPGPCHRSCLLNGARNGFSFVSAAWSPVREQAVAGERIWGHVEDPHHERPLAPDETARADVERLGAGGAHAALTGGSRRSGSSTSNPRTSPTR